MLQGAAGVVVAAAAGCATTTSTAAARGGRDDVPVRREREPRDGVVHIGNSTHLIVLDGLHILTDPWVRDPADAVLLHRVPAAPLPIHPDVVLVTHEHEDHFDEAALALVDKGATVVLPSWLEARARALGFTDVRGMNPGDVAADVRGLKLEAVRALHDVDEVAFRFERAGRAVFFGGDTLPTREILELAIRAPVDLAVLPGDGGALLGERWVMSPAEAVRMAEEFSVRAPGRGALLTHHECSVSFPWGAIVDVKPPNPADFPPWFHIPVPGERVPFPWSTA